MHLTKFNTFTMTKIISDCVFLELCFPKRNILGIEENGFQLGKTES